MPAGSLRHVDGDFGSLAILGARSQPEDRRSIDSTAFMQEFCPEPI